MTRKSGLLFALILLIGNITPVWSAKIPAIAAASNTQFALNKIAANFTQDTGLKVKITYGASGNIVAQIRHGAPFELFLAANDHYINQLHQLGVIHSKGSVYAIGHLAVVALKSSPLSLDPKLDGLKTLMEKGKLDRFAIANPEHAPYGKRALELLQQSGIWPQISKQLIYGESVTQAAQFALSGSSQGGIIALSLAMAPQFPHDGHYVALNDDQYPPLNQRMVLLDNAESTTRKFYHYLQQNKSRAVFVSFGFSLPPRTVGA